MVIVCIKVMGEMVEGSWKEIMERDKLDGLKFLRNSILFWFL